MHKATLAAAAAASLFSVSAFAADGVYSASAQGQAGPVPVTVTFEKNKIKSVEVGPNKETVGIGAVAAPKVAQRIVEAQSTDVDGVSGATVTSNAVKKASAEALAKAGFTAKKTVRDTPKALRTETLETDVLVLGGGGAGMLSAVNAADKDAKVLLLEKCDRPNGNALFALGSVCGWGSRHQKEQGIKDTAEAFYAMMMDISKQMGDKALNRLYTDKISEGIDWLEKDIGVKFGKIRPMPYPRLGRTCRVLGEGKTGGARLVEKLLEAAEKRGIDIRYEHKAIELLHDDKFAVTGVKVLTPEGTKSFLSRGGVAIATGGFSGNPEMVDRYIGGWATRMVLRGSPMITGENISLTLPLFTKFVNMDQFHSGPIIRETHVNPADVLNSGYGIQVNTSGARYMDENNTYVIKARTTGQMTLDNMAQVDVFVTDMRNFEDFNAIYSTYSPAYKPARLFVEVRGLCPGAEVEIRDIACRR